MKQHGQIRKGGGEGYSKGSRATWMGTGVAVSYRQSLRGDLRPRRRHCFVSLSPWVRDREGQGNIISLFFVTFLGAERKRDPGSVPRLDPGFR